MDARSRKFEKFNLKNLLLFSMLIILFSECKNSESKIVVNDTKIVYTIHIDREYNYFTDKLEDKKNLVQFIDNPKLVKEKVIVYKDDYDTITYSKNELNKIQKLFPYINPEITISPDDAYLKSAFIDYIDKNGKKEHYSFGSEAGQDNYFILYAYFLKHKNGEKFEKERQDLIKIYRNINEIYGRIEMRGTYFGHQYKRILGAAEYSVYLFKTHSYKYYKERNRLNEKQNFIMHLREIIKNKDKQNDVYFKDKREIDKRKEIFEKLINNINNLITNEFYLKEAKKFEVENYK